MTTCILSAPFRQFIQTIRAFGGAFYPALYFKKDYTLAPIDQNVSPDNEDLSQNEVGTRIHCSKNFPVEEPEQAIKRLAEKRNDRYAVEIKYANEDGIDYGGLRRDYISRCFWAADRKYKLSEKVINWSAENNDFFVDLGQALGYLTTVMPDCATGAVFHPTYFNILQFSYAELHAPEGFDSLSLERRFQIYYEMRDQESNDDLEDVKTILDWKGSLSEKTAEIKKISDLRCLDLDIDNLKNADEDAIKKEILEAVLFTKQDCVRTLYTIASSMDYTEESWVNLQLEGPAALQQRIHGFFSRAVFFERLEFKLISPEYETIIREWLNAQDDDTLKNFLRFVTGASMVPTDGIKFQRDEGVKMFAISCIKSVTVPLILTKDEIEFRLAEFSVSLEHAHDILGDAAGFTSL